MDGCNPINGWIQSIKNGNYRLREEFIATYKPFIKKVVMNVAGIRFWGDLESEDMFSIALMAFNEAIDRFDQDRNVGFLTFCGMVIRSRLLSFLKKDTLLQKVVPFEEELVTQAFYLYDGQEVSMELDDLSGRLKNFGISLDQLADLSPKHKDAKTDMIRIAVIIAGNKTVFEQIYVRNVFPKNDIIKLSGVNKKTIERNRSFLIAAVLIIGNGYEHLKDFIDIPKEGRIS